MKLSKWSWLIVSIVVVGRVSATEVCAGEQCSIAQKMQNLPKSVRSFVLQRDGCDHWRGEPTEFDEEYLRQAGKSGLVEQKQPTTKFNATSSSCAKELTGS